MSARITPGAGRVSRGRALISALACALLVASAAPAQTAPSFLGSEETIPASPAAHLRRPATIEAVRLGWRGHLSADCWGPARVYISGNPNVRAGAFGGTLELRFAQDGSQSAQISVPVATTPGRVTPVELAIALPLNARQLTITLYDDNGRSVDSRSYRRGDSALPVTILDATPLVLSVAERSGVAPTVSKAFPEPGLRAVGAAQNIPVIGRPSPTRNPLDDLVCITVTDNDLPETWAAYDGVAAIVIGADEIATLPQGRLAALLDWVRAGGCVIARTGTSSAGLAKLFESTPGRVEWQAPKPLTPGAELERLFAEPTPIEKDGTLASASASLHQSVLAGLLSLGERDDPDAKAWRVRWAPRDATKINGVEAQGLLAEGPMGFGWVVILGIDPPRLGAGADDAAARVAWRDVLRSCCAELATRARLSDEYNWGVRGSGADHSARSALRSALNSLSDVPALGDGAFIVIVLCLLALAAAIGPFDGLFLGYKRKRQFSWATALAWIAGASVLAAAVPPLLRGGESKLRRLRVIDAMPDTVTDGTGTLAWQTALTTLFAGSGGPVRLVPTDASSHDAAWFRGVSPLFIQPFDNTDPLVRFATVQQEPPGQSAVRGRSNRLDQQSPIRLGQWTFRTFMEQGPGSAPPAIRLDRAPANTADAWLIQVPASCGTVVDGALRIGDSWSKLRPAGTDAGGTTLRIEPGATDWNARDAIAQTGTYTDMDFRSGLALELPGTRDRSRALDARLASGEWAAVYLRCRSAEPTLTCRRLTWAGTGEAYQGGEETVYRVLIPLGEARVPRTPWSVTLPKTVAPEASTKRRRGTIPPPPDGSDTSTPPKDSDTSADDGDDEATDAPMTDAPTQPPQPEQEPKP
jgi:hypothetical protein